MQNMEYKLIALDIDGTLLDSEKKIRPRVREAIQQAVKRGKIVMLSTGRMYRAMKKINDDLGLEAPCITYGGAQIVDKGSIVYQCPVPPELTREFLDWAHEKQMHAQVYLYDDFVYEQENEYAAGYGEFFGFPGIEFPNLRRMHTILTPKILCIGEIDEVTQWIPMAKERFGEVLRITRSRPMYMEINNPNASKGMALENYIQGMGIRREECIAVGDASIDVPMMEYAGMGVAMGNSDDKTKATADYICPSNDEDGVAHVIEKFML